MKLKNLLGTALVALLTFISIDQAQATGVRAFAPVAGYNVGCGAAQANVFYQPAAAFVQRDVVVVNRGFAPRAVYGTPFVGVNRFNNIAVRVGPFATRVRIR